jgi:aryl-alcohol dehydrogenase-like predicted oxidoreductase/predicted Zn-ribbon and HTH transcriptional regulator
MSHGMKVPGERNSTVRQAILEVLERGAATARDLSRLVGISEKEVAGHLEHLQRSLKKGDRTFVMEPAECAKCGFRFTERTRLTKPSSCPECRAERVHPPQFRVVGPAESPRAPVRTGLPQRMLGFTGRRVSRIGLGLAALGRPGYINVGHGADLGPDPTIEALEARALSVLDAAFQGGIRYFDAARSYGRSEEFLARWLATAPPEVTVGSKWGYAYTAGWKVQAAVHEQKEHSLARLVSQLAESRQWLGDRLHLYQIHSATQESGVLGNREVLDELARLKEAGVAIGLTVSGPHQADTIRRALECSGPYGRIFDCVQATWNLLETSAGSALEEAHQAGLGVIVKEAVANGRLTDRPSANGLARPQRELLTGRLGRSLDQVALAAVLARPWVDVVLSGASTVDQLESNLQAATLVWDDDAEGLIQGLARVPAIYWEERAALPWN